MQRYNFVWPYTFGILWIITLPIHVLTSSHHGVSGDVEHCSDDEHHMREAHGVYRAASQE